MKKRIGNEIFFYLLQPALMGDPFPFQECQTTALVSIVRTDTFTTALVSIVRTDTFTFTFRHVYEHNSDLETVSKIRRP